jgi:hypothetical protein
MTSNPVVPVVSDPFLPVALTKRQAPLVEAAAARIFPTTDTLGVTEAGVVNYVDHALAEAYPGLLSLSRGWCGAPACESKRRYDVDFWEAAPAEQDDLLTAFEAGGVGGVPKDNECFGTLGDHTMEVR